MPVTGRLHPLSTRSSRASRPQLRHPSLSFLGNFLPTGELELFQKYLKPLWPLAGIFLTILYLGFLNNLSSAPLAAIGDILLCKISILNSYASKPFLPRSINSSKAILTISSEVRYRQ